MAYKAALSDFRNNLRVPGSFDGAVWKTHETWVVMDYSLHSKSANSPARTTPMIAMRDKGWSQLRCYTPDENVRAQDNIAAFPVTVKRAIDA